MTREEFEQYRSMAFSVTLVLFAFQDGELKIFIRKKVQDPFKGAWALPGRLISPEVSLQEASESILEETIGNRNAYLEQLNAWGKLYRHPYGRVIDIAWYGLINLQDDVVRQPQDTEYQWAPAYAMPELAFDHNEIVDFSLHRLRRRLINRPIGFKLLNKEFTMGELQGLYEAILNKELDKRNFRKRLKKLDILTELDQMDDNRTPGRNARMYRFNPKKYNHYLEHGF